MDKQIQYLQTCLPAAEKAGGTYDMNPVVILAQGALHIWPGNIITISVSWGTGHPTAIGMASGRRWKELAGYIISVIMSVWNSHSLILPV